MRKCAKLRTVNSGGRPIHRSREWKVRERQEGKGAEED